MKNASANKCLSKKEIKEIYDLGRRGHSKYFTIIWHPQNEKNVFKNAVISVPKKNIGKATSRNYLKRVIRELYRLNKHLLLDEAQIPFNIILIYNASYLTDFNKLKEELLTLFKNIKDKMHESC